MYECSCRYNKVFSHCLWLKILAAPWIFALEDTRTIWRRVLRSGDLRVGTVLLEDISCFASAFECGCESRTLCSTVYLIVLISQLKSFGPLRPKVQHLTIVPTRAQQQRRHHYHYEAVQHLKLRCSVREAIGNLESSQTISSPLPITLEMLHFRRTSPSLFQHSSKTGQLASA